MGCHQHRSLYSNFRAHCFSKFLVRIIKSVFISTMFDVYLKSGKVKISKLSRPLLIIMTKKLLLVVAHGIGRQYATFMIMVIIYISLMYGNKNSFDFYASWHLSDCKLLPLSSIYIIGIVDRIDNKENIWVSSKRTYRLNCPNQDGWLWL